MSTYHIPANLTRAQQVALASKYYEDIKSNDQDWNKEARTLSSTNYMSKLDRIIKLEVEVLSLIKAFKDLSIKYNFQRDDPVLATTLVNVKKFRHKYWDSYSLPQLNPAWEIDPQILTKHTMSTKDDTFVTSIHPRCKNLYSQYDKTCGDCARSLFLSMTKQDSHEFTTGDLSIMFYYYKKLLTQIKLQKTKCTIAERMVESITCLLDCLRGRIYHHQNCTQPKQELQNHSSKLAIGDPGHSKFILFTCLDVLTFMHFVKTQVIDKGCSASMTDKFKKICTEYSSVLTNCVTMVRQQLQAYHDDKKGEYIPLKEYIPKIQESLIYNEIVGRDLKYKQYKQYKVEFDKVNKLRYQFQLLTTKAISPHMFIWQYNTWLYDSLNQLHDLNLLDMQQAQPLSTSYKYTTIPVQQGNIDFTADHQAQIETDTISQYTDLYKQYVGSGLSLHCINAEVDTLTANIALQLQLTDPQYLNWLKAYVAELLKQRSDDQRKYIMSTVQDLIYYLYRQLDKHTSDLASYLKKKYNYNYDDHDKELVKQVNHLAKLNQASKQTYKALGNSTYFAIEYNNTLLAHISRKFEQLLGSGEDVYDYNDHTNQIHQMLKQKEVRPCGEVSNSAHHHIPKGDKDKKDKKSRYNDDYRVRLQPKIQQAAKRPDPNKKRRR